MDWQPKNSSPPDWRTTSTYQASAITDEVIVPALKAIFLGLLDGATAGLAVHLVDNYLTPIPISPWLAGLTAGVTIAAIAFRQLSERAHGMIERITGADLMPVDYSAPPPEPEPAQTIRLLVDQNEGQEVDYLDLGARPDQLLTLAQALVRGESLGINRWAGNGFTRGQIEAIRAEMEKRGLARKENPNAHNSPMVLTGKGRAAMRQFASMTLAPDGKRLLPPAPTEE